MNQTVLTEKPELVPRRLATWAMTIGLVALLGTAAAGVFAYLSSRDALRQTVAAENLALSRTICKTASLSGVGQNTDDQLDGFVETWARTEPPFPGAYLCVISSAGKLALHSKKPEMKGTDVCGVVVSETTGQTVIDLLQAKQSWSGQNTNFRGIQQLVGYHYDPQMDALVAVHVPTRDVDRSFGAAVLPWVIAMALTGGLLMPCSLGLFYYGSGRAWNVVEHSHSALLESESRFRRMVDELPQLIWLAGVDREHSFFNQRWLDYTGRATQQACRENWAMDVHPDDVDQCLSTSAAAFEKREQFQVEYRLRNVDGDYRWFLDTGRPWSDITGEFAGFIGSCVDITEHRSAVAALQLSEERYRGFVQNSSEGIYLCEFEKPLPISLSEDEQIIRIMNDGHIAACNNVFTSMYGYESPDDLLGVRVIDMYRDDDNEVNDEFLRKMVRSEYSIVGAISEEFDKHGERVVFSNNCMGIVEDGHLIRVWGSQTDVTKSIIAQRELKASRESLREAQRIAKLASWEFHPDTQKTIWSEELLQLFAPQLNPDSPESLEALLQLIHPEDRTVVLRQQQQILNTAERIENFDLRTNPDNGPTRWLDVAVYRKRYADDHGFYVAGTVIDITERKQMELRLAESESRLRAIFEAEPECVKLVGRDGDLQMMNPAGLSMIEADALAEVRGMCVYNLISDEHRNAFQEMHNAVFCGETRQLAFEIQGIRGARRWMQSNSSPLKDADGNVIAALSVSSDVTEKRLREQALQLSEQRYRSLVKASASTNWVTGPRGGFQTPQKSWEEYTGSPWEEHQGFGWTNNLHPDDRDRIQSAWTARMQNPPELHFDEGRLWHAASQEYHYFEVRAVPIRNEDGQVTEWVGTTTDIHKRRSAETELCRREAELAKAQQIAHLGNWEYQISDGAIRFSDELYRIYGLEPQSVAITMDVLQPLIHPDDWDAVEGLRLMVQGISRQREVPSLEHRVLCADGSEKNVLIHVEVVDFDEHHRPLCAVGTMQDVTGQKQAEKFLAEEKRILEMIAAGADSRIVLNEIVRFVESHAAGVACSILLLDETGKQLRHGAASSLPQSYITAIDGVAIGPEAGSCGTAAYLNEPVTVTDISIDPLWKNYKHLALEAGLRACWSVPLRSSVREVMGTLAMYFREPTHPTSEHETLISRAEHLAAIVIEKTRTSEQARVAQKQLLEQQKNETARVKTELDRISAELVTKTRMATIGQMSAQIAHDLRNPLGAVRNAAFYLKGELHDSPEFVEFLTVIEDEVMTCDTIIRNLLEATRPREPDRKPINASDLARAAVQRLPAPSGVTVNFDTRVEPFVVDFDPVQFRQLMDNLLSNALEAVAQDGVIDVTMWVEDDCKVVRVADSGPGIAPGLRELVFEMLFTTRAKGTGLGLAICREIVERHGATIELENPNSGGAAFVIRIPKPEVTRN